MDFITCLLLTLVNAVVCITIPKALSLILAPKPNRDQTWQPTLKTKTAEF